MPARSHGMTNSQEMRIWIAMRQRCLNQNNTSYKLYGGRGIAVCERWDVFENFYSDIGPRPSKSHSIERRNVDGDYEPANCYWATTVEQARNRRVLKEKVVPAPTGVVWDKNRGKWVARVKLNRKTINLGRFDKIEDAVRARAAGVEKYWAAAA